MRVVSVDLGKDSYDIFLGNQLKLEIESFIKQAKLSQKALVISDSNVGPIYGQQIIECLKNAGIDAKLYEIPAGESSKSMQTAEKLYDCAMELDLDRKSAIIALGGGVVGDITGFIAATYMRGVPFIQIPTSLLAQVDSSVGGKVAVNHPLGKNMIGAFYQPKAVFIDLDVLQTLPAREVYTGLGEIVKYGIIYDAEFFAYLEQHTEDILALKQDVMMHLIARSCEIKALVVSEDEKEQGLRKILNFGHTVAHAIEKETEYKRYNHGEAVAIGMLAAGKISLELGMITEESFKRVKALIQALHLPVQAEGCTVEKMLVDIMHDKKAVNGKVEWVLMKDIGKVCTSKDISDELACIAMKSVVVD